MKYLREMCGCIIEAQTNANKKKIPKTKFFSTCSRCVFFVLFYLEGTVHLQKGACGLSMIVLMQLITLFFNTVY